MFCVVQLSCLSKSELRDRHDPQTICYKFVKFDHEMQLNPVNLNFFDL